jgi:glycerol uptake facilitator protein
MNSELFGEFMGTLVLIFLGNSVVASVVLNKSKGQNSGWIVICMGFWLAVMAGVFTAIACGSPGAHINPAVTLGLAIAGKTSFDNFLPYFAAQLAGAFVGQTLVWLQFLPHWEATPDQGGKLACFSTGPAIKNTMTNLISEILGTAMLVFLIACVVSSKVSAGLAPGLAPFLIGGIVAAIGFGIGGVTGFAINPARDLGPRIAHAILPISGKGDSDWGYAMVPVVGGLLGAVVAGLLISFAAI